MEDSINKLSLNVAFWTLSNLMLDWTTEPGLKLLYYFIYMHLHVWQIHVSLL